jgi:RHS repeat-associated protein
MSNKRKRVELGSESSLADKDGDGYIEPFNVNPYEQNSGGTSDAPVDLTDTEVYQETHYYPFGMTMEGEWQNIVNGPENNYLYNGKELNSDFGLDWSDYGARYYDASIGRWNAIDPLAEGYYPKSPYCYVMNNPISYVDPDGMKVEYADNVDEKTREKIDNLKNESEAFAFLYSVLDNLQDAEGNDIVFTITGGEPRKRKGYKSNGEVSIEIGGEIFLSTEATNTTISEEFFHKFQMVSYGLAGLRVKGRANRELDAEAKLFNTVVTGESTDDRDFIPGYEEWLTDDSFQTALKDSRYQVIVTGKSVDARPFPGDGESDVSILYRRYLKAFRDGNKYNPAYRGPQRALSPAAFNKLMKQKQDKE